VTPDELDSITAPIYRVLGLRDPYDFALEAMRRNLSEGRVAELTAKVALREHHRQTGQTTRMLVKAIAVLQNGDEVYILSGTERGARHLRREMRELLRRLNSLGLQENAKFTTEASMNEEMEAVGGAERRRRIVEATFLIDPL
jgi:16S rRNA G1207 methylase RsmC